MVTIRAGRAEDGPALLTIELQAGARFREIDVPSIAAVADHDPGSVEELAAYADAGRSRVAVDDDGTVGYVVVDVVDGCAHIEQISVHPDRQGSGIGRSLIEQVEAWAAVTPERAMTLTTFRDVPWNGPLYEHLGFRVLDDAEIGPRLRALMAEEAGHGLDPDTRVAMRRDLRRD
jgi:GNAT superfamily N-acetyltransferase